MNEELAENLMNDFADATGLTTSMTPRRYLWTDAFAVCNFLALKDHTGDARYLQLAVDLVDQVHHVLGRYRAGDFRTGWISGLSEDDGEKHPTRGGLRIGKSLDERSLNAPYDPELEWDRDGQYFHYLTKWMHALRCLSSATEDKLYLIWAEELAETAHRAFVYAIPSNQQKRMVWKMSVDLSRPLVPSMGQHDPLDGFVTLLELQAAAEAQQIDWICLKPALADFQEISSQLRWITDDLLGIGGLLEDVARLTRLVFQQGARHQLNLLKEVLVEAIQSLQTVNPSTILRRPADRRLAFRELGFSIGLHGVQHSRALIKDQHDLSKMFDQLLTHGTLASQIEAFWAAPCNRLWNTWNEHCDINSVMLATSLLPMGYAGS